MGGVVDAVKKVVKTIIKVVVGVVKSVVNFVGDVIGFVINPFGSFDTPTVSDPGAEAQGVTVTKQGTNIAIPVVYGYRRVGGSNIFTETNGSSNKYLYVVYSLCEGEIEGVGQIHVNDVPLPVPGGNTYNHGQVYSVEAGRFKDRIKLQIFNGTENQSQSSLANESASWGKKSRKLPGLAYAVMRYEWSKIETQEDADNNPFSGGIPQAKFDVFGKKVYDVRTHAGGKDLINTYATRPKSYQINPANCLLDYMQNPRYGGEIPDSQIDAESFKIAADKYEQTVRYSNSQNGRALTMNAVVGTGTKVLDNIKNLVAGSRGIMPYVQGRYKIKVEDGGNATDISSTEVNIAYDVDAREVIGGISLTGERKSSKYNQVIVNYIDPDQDFTNQQVVYDVDGDRTIDNDELLTGEFTFHTITNPAIAFDLAQMIYDKSRKQRNIQFQASQDLLDVEVGDVIRVTDTVLDLNLDTFRVTGMKLRPDGLVDIEAVEHDATLYPFTTGPQIDIPPPIYRPDEFIIKPYYRKQGQLPISIFPPIDPDDPFSNNPLPPSWDDPDPAVTRFEAYDSTTGEENRWFNLGYIQTNGTEGLAEFLPAFSQYNNADTYKYSYGAVYGQYGYQYFYLVPPLDVEIDHLVIRWYRNGDLIHDSNYESALMVPIRNIGPRGLKNPIGGIKDLFTDKYLPRFWSLLMPTEPGLTAQVRWRKDALDLEYPDGSVLQGFSYTYQIPDGTTRTSSNIEAYVNYLVDLHDAKGLTSSIGGSVNLGE